MNFHFPLSSKINLNILCIKLTKLKKVCSKSSRLWSVDSMCAYVHLNASFIKCEGSNICFWLLVECPTSKIFHRHSLNLSGIWNDVVRQTLFTNVCPPRPPNVQEMYCSTLVVRTGYVRFMKHYCGNSFVELVCFPLWNIIFFSIRTHTNCFMFRERFLRGPAQK